MRDQQANIKEPENIYILSAVSVRENTEEELKKRFAYEKSIHPKISTFEKYLSFLKDFGIDKYRCDTYDTAYFPEEETGAEYARENMADINESGAYPYLCLYSRPVNTMYAEANPCTARVFVFNRANGTYDEVTDFEHNEIASFVKSQFDCFHHQPKR